MFIILENRVQGPSGKVPGSFPQVMTVQYVQVCDENLDSARHGRRQLRFFDHFTEAPATPSAQLISVERCTEERYIYVMRIDALADKT